MTILFTAPERSLFFAGQYAFNIQDTKNYMYELKGRLENEFLTSTYDEVMKDLTDLQFLVEGTPGNGMMVDIHTNTYINIHVWFLRYGIRDRTFEFFNGDNSDDLTINTFDMTETDIDSDDISDIDSIDEIILVHEAMEGSEENPIELD